MFDSHVLSFRIFLPGDTVIRTFSFSSRTSSIIDQIFGQIMSVISIRWLMRKMFVFNFVHHFITGYELVVSSRIDHCIITIIPGFQSAPVQARSARHRAHVDLDKRRGVWKADCCWSKSGMLSCNFIKFELTLWNHTY